MEKKKLQEDLEKERQKTRSHRVREKNFCKTIWRRRAKIKEPRDKKEIKTGFGGRKKFTRGFGEGEPKIRKPQSEGKMFFTRGFWSLFK